MMKLRNWVFILGILSFATASWSKAEEPAKSAGSSSSGKNINISVAPLGLLIGIANVTAEFGISDSITLGPSFSYTKLASGLSTGQTIGLGADAIFYLGHARYTDGVLLDLDVSYAMSSIGTATASGLGFGANFAYGWFYNGGFNIALGGGLSYSTASIVGYSISLLTPSFLFRLGYSF